MDLRFSVEEEAFRDEARAWLEENLDGPFAEVRGRGAAGDELGAFEARRAWERHMGDAGWTCLGWPVEHGGRGASLNREVIFHEEYARARGPGRVGHIGETLLGPTLLAFGTDEQKERFLPPIRLGEELWCQGYSEPNAGSDLANIQTRAELDGDEWVLTGQKVWTSGAQWADWCFVICRTDPDAPRKHDGLSYLLVPMKQDGVEIRPIEQMTGDSEFSEVFFDGARTARGNVVGAVGDGWKVSMATLAFERGASTLAQQLGFENELRQVTEIAREMGRLDDPILRDRISRAWMELDIMRLNALRNLAALEAGTLSREAMITKLYWANWHRDLGKLAMDVLGMASEEAGDFPYDLTLLQRLFLFTRADTIYAGSNQIQRNIIGERALGLPREPKAVQ